LAKTKSKKSKLSANIDRINSIAKNNVSNSTILNTIFTPVSFAFNVSTITVPQMDAADSLVRIMKTYSDVKVLVAAYADSRGSFEYNMSLSEKRAASVKKYLVKNGIPTNRIITKGLGEMNLLNQCVDGVICSEEQHAVNRRVEMKLVK
jgi:outer membrane protein OmpA-like peptidoglycan-associated protein